MLRKSITGNSTCISLYPEHIIDQLETGDILSIDFNCVIAQVIEKKTDELTLRVLTSWTVGQNKAVTVMNRPIVLPPLTEKDKQALQVRGPGWGSAMLPSPLRATRRTWTL